MLGARWLPYLMLFCALGCGRCEYEEVVPRDGDVREAGQGDASADAQADAGEVDAAGPGEPGGSCESDDPELTWKCSCHDASCRFGCPEDQPDCDTECTGSADCEQVCHSGSSCRVDCSDSATCTLHCATETCAPCMAGTRCRLECVDDACSVSL